MLSRGLDPKGRSVYHAHNLIPRFEDRHMVPHETQHTRVRVRVRVAQKLPLILTFSPEGRRNDTAPRDCRVGSGSSQCSRLRVASFAPRPSSIPAYSGNDGYYAKGFTKFTNEVQHLEGCCHGTTVLPMSFLRFAGMTDPFSGSRKWAGRRPAPFSIDIFRASCKREGKSGEAGRGSKRSPGWA